MPLNKVEDAAAGIIDEISTVTGLDPTVTLIALAVLVLIAVFIFTKPIRLVLKLVINTLVGFAALWVLNKIGAGYGIALALDLKNAVITGVFGIPGVAVLLVLRWAGIL